MKKIFDELAMLWESIEKDAVADVVEVISQCERNIICLGAGRMGYAAQSFAMRLSHLGFRAFMIGDTALPRVNKGDLIIINSSSGETPSIVLLAKLAKKYGGRLICLTSDGGSTLANMSEFTLVYERHRSSQLMKSLYEQFSFLLFDHMAQEIFIASGKERAWVENNHSILE